MVAQFSAAAIPFREFARERRRFDFGLRKPKSKRQFSLANSRDGMAAAENCGTKSSLYCSLRQTITVMFGVHYSDGFPGGSGPGGVSSYPSAQLLHAAARGRSVGVRILGFGLKFPLVTRASP